MSDKHNICIPECFRDLIVYDDGCRPPTCDPDTKSLTTLLAWGVDITMMETLATAELKTWKNVADAMVNAAWDFVLNMINTSLTECGAFTSKGIIFDGELCDMPSDKKISGFVSNGQSGGRIKFLGNSNLACNTITELKILKLNQGEGTYTLKIKDGANVTEIEVELKYGWNPIELNYEMQNDIVDICFADGKGLKIGQFPCLAENEGCGCTGREKYPNSYRHDVFMFSGLIGGKYGSVHCPQINGIIPTIKSECKIELLLCKYKREICQAVLYHIGFLLMQRAIDPNCRFTAYNTLGHEQAKSKMGIFGNLVKKQVKNVILPMIKNDPANKHDDCLHCESAIVHGWGGF